LNTYKELFSKTIKKPAFLCDFRKSRAKGRGLCHVT
jgi:hypothetical protein